VSNRVSRNGRDQRLVAGVVHVPEAPVAELDLITREFVLAVLAHEAGCSTCSQRGPWCSPLREAFDAVLEWRAGRILRSKAAYLRTMQELRERAAA
jgi:hypothetical protein